MDSEESNGTSEEVSQIVNNNAVNANSDDSIKNNNTAFINNKSDYANSNDCLKNNNFSAAYFVGLWLMAKLIHLCMSSFLDEHKILNSYNYYK